MGKFSEIIHQYVIYDHPKDYPDKFVMRRFDIYPGWAAPGPFMGEADTIEELRKLLPSNVASMPVFENDDPVIAEVWM